MTYYHLPYPQDVPISNISGSVHAELTSNSARSHTSDSWLSVGSASRQMAGAFTCTGANAIGSNTSLPLYLKVECESHNYIVGSFCVQIYISCFSTNLILRNISSFGIIFLYLYNYRHMFHIQAGVSN